MPDGRTLQVGTAHHLGSTFAKTYEITYEAEDGEQKLISQTCYGISERCIAALISVHGDDKGLVLPWGVAPVQVVIVPILLGDKELVLEVCRSLQQKLREAGIRVQLDTSDERPGAKFYKWEMKGVPIRLEVGPRDIQKGVVTMARRDGLKKAVPIESLVEFLFGEAGDIQAALYSRAEQFRDSKVKGVIEHRRGQSADRRRRGPCSMVRIGGVRPPARGQGGGQHARRAPVRLLRRGGVRRLRQGERQAHLHGQTVLI